MSKLLLDESPIFVLPSLAEKVGLNESIFLQQLHYWLVASKNIEEGHKWVYNTYDGWLEQFPFWSKSTLRRTITSLENQNLIIKGNFNKLKIDKTIWYRIDYEVFESVNSPCVQNEQTVCSKRADEEFTLNTPLPEITTESTSDIKEVEEEAATNNENPFNFFEENGFGVIGGYISQKISKWCEDLSDELVLEAMKMAVERGAKSWSYVEKILINWADKNIKTVNQANALKKEFKENRSKGSNRSQGRYPPKRTELLPDWFEQENQPEPKTQKKDTEDSAQKQLEFEAMMKKLREGNDKNGT